MTARGGFDRRRLLLGGAVAAATVVTRPWRIVAFVESPIERRLAGVLPSGDGTRRIGRAYLRAHPHEADPRTLAVLLERSLRAPSGATSADLAAAAAGAIEGELRSRTVVLVDGWVAAPTEARLAALTTLVAPTDAPRSSGW